MDEQVKRRIQYEDGMTEFTVENNAGFPVAVVHAIPGKWWLCLRCDTGRCSHTIAVERAITARTLVDAGLVRLSDPRADPVPDPNDPVFEPAPEEETLHEHLIVLPTASAATESSTDGPKDATAEASDETPAV